MADIDLGWAAIASTIYFSLYFLLLMGLAYHVHKTGDHTNKKSFLLAIWKKKAIYGQILLHLYDTATDVGVLVEWYILSDAEKKGNNVESLDMSALFWTSIGFIIVYRVFSIIIGCFSGWNDDSICKCCFDGFLGLIDMYIIKTVYNAIKDDEEEPTVKQKMIQLAEAILESLPQVVLQSVYIIRGQNDPQIRAKSTLFLVGLSLLASLLSITNKFIWFDKEGVKDDAKEDEISIKLPSMTCCKSNEDEHDEQEMKQSDNDIKDEKDVEETDEHRTDTNITDNTKAGQSKTRRTGCSFVMNKWYLLRVIWRFSYIVTRFSILSLVWSVLGGAFLGIYLFASWLMWFILFEIAWIIDEDLCSSESGCDWYACGGTLILVGTAIVSLGATPAYEAYSFAIGHGIEMLVTMITITVFAFDLSFECSICAQPDDRNAMDNVYILSFIIAGWIAMIIDFISYFIMFHFELFDDDEIFGVLKVLDDGTK